MAAGQQHDENQIYGCLMVPVDLHRVHAPEQDPSAPVERKAWRSSWRWRPVIWPTLRQKKRVV